MGLWNDLQLQANVVGLNELDEGNIPVSSFPNDAGYVTAETDPTVLASVKDGVDWTELSGIPADIADGDDGYTACADIDQSCLGFYTDADIDGSEAAFTGWDKDASDDLTLADMTGGHVENAGGFSLKLVQGWNTFQLPAQVLCRPAAADI